MKKFIFLIFSILFLQACTDEQKTNNTAPSINTKETQQTDTSTSEPKAKTWNGTSLSDTTIKEVQQAKYTYTQCVYTEAQKQGYTKIDSRVATDAVIKQCEPDLTKIREVFTSAGVPEIIADRYLKKTRVNMTRKILKSLMFAEAARKAGATQ